MPELRRPIKIAQKDIGCLQYEVVNNSEYCGKILVHEKDSMTPAHSHKEKHETFLLWSGKLKMLVDGETYWMQPGDVISIDRGTVHEFSAVEGAATILEFSTPSSPKDSYFVEEGMWEKVNNRQPEMTDYPWPF